MTLRLRTLVLMLAVILVAAAAPAGAATPEDLTLRLADLGPGYLIPDETCLPTRLRGDGTSRVVDQVGRLPHRGCEIAFSRAWVAPGAPAGLAEASSHAFVFEDTRGPEAALTRPRTLISFMYEPTREELEVVEPAPAIGDEAALLRGDEERFRGRSWWPAFVLWRSGNVLAAVQAVGHKSADASAQAALRLAAAQQARIALPTPLSPADHDDAEVRLDAPGLRLPIYWLGHDLAARGDLPGLLLHDSFPLESLGTENMFLSYGRDDEVVIALIPPGFLQRPFLRRELRRVARDPCTRRQRVTLRSGRATVWSSRGRGCHPRPEYAFAIARLPGVAAILTIDAERGPAARYATRTGMLRLLRALRERPSPPR